MSKIKLFLTRIELMVVIDTLSPIIEYIDEHMLSPNDKTTLKRAQKKLKNALEGGKS